MKTLIVIPAYNEKDNIERVVDNLIENFPQYDYVVVNDINPDTQTQAVGRVRHDLETVYLRDKNTKERYFVESEVVTEWLNRRLYTEEKNILCEELKLRDNRGRLLKWNSVTGRI